MFTIKMTAATLSQFLPRFSMEALEALADYLEEAAPNEAFYIGDLDINFAEIPAGFADDEEIIAELENGNVLIAH